MERAPPFRFMGRGVFRSLDTPWDQEPDRPKGVTKPSPGQRPGDGVSIVASALKGRAQCAGRMARPFRAEWFFGWGFPRALPWAGFGEGRWPVDADHAPIEGRFMGIYARHNACSWVGASRDHRRAE